MDLIGLDGLGKLSAVDLPDIAQQELLDVIKRLPEGDAVKLLSKLPENIITQVCVKGTNEKLSAYLPTAIVGIGGGIVVGLATNSFLYGLLTLIIAGVGVYFITQPNKQ